LKESKKEREERKIKEMLPVKVARTMEESGKFQKIIDVYFKCSVAFEKRKEQENSRWQVIEEKSPSEC